MGLYVDAHPLRLSNTPTKYKDTSFCIVKSILNSPELYTTRRVIDLTIDTEQSKTATMGSKQGVFASLLTDETSDPLFFTTSQPLSPSTAAEDPLLEFQQTISPTT